MSCKCQGCGKQYRIDLGVPDSMWERIKPPGKAVGAGLLCGSCIMERLEAMGQYGFYELAGSNPQPISKVIESLQTLSGEIP